MNRSFLLIRKNMKPSGRIQREAATVATMIRRYCQEHHHCGNRLCKECSELLNYCNHRLSRCPFQEGKTTCGQCRVHCYQPAMREKIRTVMQTVGPQMILTNPIMALQHAVDGLRKNPKKNNAIK
jgi:hypothetical protein